MGVFFFFFTNLENVYKLSHKLFVNPVSNIKKKCFFVLFMRIKFSSSYDFFKSTVAFFHFEKKRLIDYDPKNTNQPDFGLFLCGFCEILCETLCNSSLKMSVFSIFIFKVVSNVIKSLSIN